MATLTLPQQPRGRVGYTTPTPRLSTADRIAILDKQSKNQQLTNQQQAAARVELARLKAELDAEAQSAEFTSKKQLAEALAAAKQGLLQMQTSSTHNENELKRQAALEAQRNKKTVKYTTKDEDSNVIEQDFTGDEFKRFKAQKAADKNEPEVARLQTARDALAEQILKEGPKGWGWGANRNDDLAKMDSDLKKAQIPEDLLSKMDIVPENAQEAAAPAPAVPQTRSPFVVSGISSMTGPGWAPPTPRGIIGTPERNAFTAETDLPDNLDRAGLDAWAIANNTPSRGPDLISPAGQQPGYNPAMGSFQTTAPAPPENLPGAPGEADWSIPQDLLSAPSFQPAMGDLRASEGNLTAPVPPGATSKPKEVTRFVKGKPAIFDSETKKFLRYAD